MMFGKPQYRPNPSNSHNSSLTFSHDFLISSIANVHVYKNNINNNIEIYSLLNFVVDATLVIISLQPQKVFCPERKHVASLIYSWQIHEKRSARWHDITKAMAYHIAKTVQFFFLFFATVAQEGFKKLLETIEPRHQLLSRNHMAKEAVPEIQLLVTSHVPLQSEIALRPPT